jgi:hypothetical protein
MTNWSGHVGNGCVWRVVGDDGDARTIARPEDIIVKSLAS